MSYLFVEALSFGGAVDDCYGQQMAPNTTLVALARVFFPNRHSGAKCKSHDGSGSSLLARAVGHRRRCEVTGSHEAPCGRTRKLLSVDARSGCRESVRCASASDARVAKKRQD
jgi:hypothetical protein